MSTRRAHGWAVIGGRARSRGWTSTGCCRWFTDVLELGGGVDGLALGTVDVLVDGLALGTTDGLNDGLGRRSHNRS